MKRSFGKDALPVGAISKSWWVRLTTVLLVSMAGIIVGFLVGHVGVGLLMGVIGGLGCVVMGESSMDTGAYKYPDERGGF